MSVKDLTDLLVDAERHRISDLCAELKTDFGKILTVLDPKRQMQRYGHVKLKFGFSLDNEYIYLWSERAMNKGCHQGCDVRRRPYRLKNLRGRRRLEITAKDKGKVIFHKSGPGNIVMGLYFKWLETSDWPRHCPHCGQEIPTIMFTEHVQGCVRRHAEPQRKT